MDKKKIPCATYTDFQTAWLASHTERRTVWNCTSRSSSFSGKSWLPEMRNTDRGWSMERREERTGEERKGEKEKGKERAFFLPLEGHWTGRSLADAGPASGACWDLALQTGGSNTPAGDGAATAPTRKKTKNTDISTSEVIMASEPQSAFSPSRI